MALLPLVLLTVLALAGAALGVFIALRGTSARDVSATTEGSGLLRLTAQVHTGWEQTLIGLIRELQLPRQVSEVAYGNLYVETRNENRVDIRSRSEIGRGFLGTIELEPASRRTDVTYSIQRLPGDDTVRARVLDLELLIIGALRRIDRDVDVQLSGAALRELDRGELTG